MAQLYVGSDLHFSAFSKCSFQPNLTIQEWAEQLAQSCKFYHRFYCGYHMRVHDLCSLDLSQVRERLQHLQARVEKTSSVFLKVLKLPRSSKCILTRRTEKHTPVGVARSPPTKLRETPPPTPVSPAIIALHPFRENSRKIQK